MEILTDTKEHPTAEEIFHATRKVIPQISLGTVYRNLDYLIAAGMVKKIETGTGGARFDGDLSDHYHQRCVQCGRIEDIYDLSLLEFHPESIEARDFEILGHRLEFYGICKNCKKENKSKN
jgi:Fe2+ or Zn2+ uptake regulation protein